jgi:hypothetical protein
MNKLTIIVERRLDRVIESPWPYRVTCPNLSNIQYPGEKVDIITKEEKNIILSLTNKSMALLNIHHPENPHYKNSIKIICQEILKADKFEIIDKTNIEE